MARQRQGVSPCPPPPPHPLSSHPTIPISNPSQATAVQYLHRFYLSNSTLTYPPRETYKCALFLASKTEGVHMTLSEYARRISTDAQLILAPEYKIIQALRFTLDVRQPFRGLKGALMELLNIAAGRGAVPQHSRTGKTGAELQTLMAELPGVADGDRSTWAAPAGAAAADPRVLADRAHVAYGVARQILDAPALLTDVYFLFTPPQIYFGALMLADSVLAGFYLSTKLALESPVRGKVLATIGACRDMLGAWSPQGVMSKEERAGLEARLERCRDPTTRDLVGAMAAEKRGGGDEGALDDGVAKRRKLEREKSMKEGEDLFGPSLPTVGNAA